MRENEKRKAEDKDLLQSWWNHNALGQTKEKAKVTEAEIDQPDPEQKKPTPPECQAVNHPRQLPT